MFSHSLSASGTPREAEIGVSFGPEYLTGEGKSQVPTGISARWGLAPSSPKVAQESGGFRTGSIKARDLEKSMLLGKDHSLCRRAKLRGHGAKSGQCVNIPLPSTKPISEHSKTLFQKGETLLTSPRCLCSNETEAGWKLVVEPRCLGRSTAGLGLPKGMCAMIRDRESVI